MRERKLGPIFHMAVGWMQKLGGWGTPSEEKLVLLLKWLIPLVCEQPNPTQPVPCKVTGQHVP